jgi:predicted  nucleic acid-binding Zn-ribbon protein
MKEQDVRNKAKAWIVKNNNLLAYALDQDGLAKVIEEAFVAGSEENDAKDSRIRNLEDQIDELYGQIDELESKLSGSKDTADALSGKLDLSVASLR